MTTQQKTNSDRLRWRLYPWAKRREEARLVPSPFTPGEMVYAGDPATSTIEPKPEWFAILELWLHEYKPPAPPDRWMLQHLLMGEPFNLRPDELAWLSIENVMVLLRNNEPSAGERKPSNPPRKPHPSRSPGMSIKQFGKALIMDPYRVFKQKAIAEWDLKPDKDAHNKWTIDYILLNDPGKQRQIEERAALLRDKEKKSSAT